MPCLQSKVRHRLERRIALGPAVLASARQGYVAQASRVDRGVGALPDRALVRDRKVRVPGYRDGVGILGERRPRVRLRGFRPAEHRPPNMRMLQEEERLAARLRGARLDRLCRAGVLVVRPVRADEHVAVDLDRRILGEILVERLSPEVLPVVREDAALELRRVRALLDAELAVFPAFPVVVAADEELLHRASAGALPAGEHPAPRVADRHELLLERMVREVAGYDDGVDLLLVEPPQGADERLRVVAADFVLGVRIEHGDVRVAEHPDAEPAVRPVERPGRGRESAPREKRGPGGRPLKDEPSATCHETPSVLHLSNAVPYRRALRPRIASGTS